MTPLLVAILLANGSPGFDVPIADGELARSSAPIVAAGAMIAAAPYAVRNPAADQMDVWWAEDGMMMIAESVRPAPTPPGWFDPSTLRANALTLRFDRSITATTR